MKENAPETTGQGSIEGKGANTPFLPVPRTTVNRLAIIQHKIRKSGLQLVDVAELAGLKFSTVFALVYLGLVSSPDLVALETLFSGEASYVQ